MTFTTHGYHIPGTPKMSSNIKGFTIESCGGILRCPDCKNESVLYWQNMTATDYIGFAKKAVTEYVDSYLDKTDEPPAFEVYVVWFTKALDNWKALLSTTLPDGMYYELTYNGAKDELYFDAYKKFENRVLKRYVLDNGVEFRWS